MTNLKLIVLNGIEHKTCKRCNKLKSLSEFYSNKKGIGGKTSRCKKCSYASSNKKYSKWSKEKVIQELKDISNKDNEIDTVLINNKLYQSSIYYFGSLDNALLAGNFKHLNKDRRVIWTRDSIQTEIKLKFKNGEDLRYTTIKKSHSGLHNAALREFGTWRNAVVESGIDYQNIYKKWSKEKILFEINYLHKNKISLVANRIIQEYNPLYQASCHYFGSWRKAVIATGIDYDIIVNPIIEVCEKGIAFENILGEILKDLKIDYTKGFSAKLKPDFVLNDGHWIDAKLSQWTAFSSKCETIEKYSSHCKKLTIVYLQGDVDKDKMINDKVHLISVYKLIEKLPNEKQDIYNSKLENIIYHTVKTA